LNRHAIVPIQQFAYTQGKNSTDTLLIIDAMDLLYTGNLDGFAIVSSDSDFTSLATRLREAGKSVYGLGQRKTPEAFRTACTRFIFLEVLGQDESQTDQEPATDGDADPDADPDTETAPLPDLRRLLTSSINATSTDDGWVYLGSLGNYLNNTHSSFDPRNYGFGRLITLLRDQDYLEVDSEGQPRVRMAPSGPPRPAKKAAVKKATTTTSTRRAGGTRSRGSSE
jgi:hypothetical protein